MENVNLQNSNNIQVNRAVENKDLQVNNNLDNIALKNTKGKI